MSITDPVTLEYNDKRGAFWLSRGGETFYSDDREMLEWEDPLDAMIWASENGIPIHDSSVAQDWKPANVIDGDNQMPLFGDLND